ncbi:hypothetical protein SEA_MARCIE_2 [Microbacterium phage Marcie]|nr:hypothetical protein SEA_MARCIE_2 [Microbacterium phage Marcie]
MEFWEFFVAGFVGALSYALGTALIDHFWPKE